MLAQSRNPSATINFDDRTPGSPKNGPPTSRWVGLDHQDGFSATSKSKRQESERRRVASNLSVALRERHDKHGEMKKLTQVLRGPIPNGSLAKLHSNGERNDRHSRAVLLPQFRNVRVWTTLPSACTRACHPRHARAHEHPRHRPTAPSAAHRLSTVR